MGVFGALAVFISFYFHWPTWVMFIAWISYYLFGQSVKTSAQSFLQIACGIFMGIIMQGAATWSSGIIGPLGFPLAVFILIGSLAYISKIRQLNNIPAWFLGLIVFFGVHPALEPMPVLNIFIPLFFGFLFAFSNDNLVKRVSKVAFNS